jgi:hypothetical protein
LTGDEYRAPCIGSREQIASLSPGRQFFDDLQVMLRREFGARKADADAAAACLIHERMSALPRSVAVQAGFWHQVALLDAQRYLRWRWNGPDGSVPVVRLLGRGASPWRNGVARLWWVGEICGGDPTKVRLICGVQQAIDSVADQRISANASWVDALCLRLEQDRWGTREVKLACRIGNQIARTRLLADLSREELADSIDLIMAQVDSSIELEV